MTDKNSKENDDIEQHKDYCSLKIEKDDFIKNTQHSNSRGMIILI